MVFLQKILEEVQSPINGKIEVVKSMGLGIYIQVEGITQSGGVVYDIWKYTLRRLVKKKKDVKKVLILGLGGGSAAKLVQKYWPEAKVVGVEIDPEMVRLGRKHLGLRSVDIHIQDAKDFCKKSDQKHDLILVDLYLADSYPKIFESKGFISNVKKLLLENGIIVFNRLYYGDKRPEAVKFGRKLEKYFPKVEIVFPEANVLFLCFR